ncbi:hypothetical protein [Longispora albida]|uniref:hypothetical protein n=1 Tax=Longispora albida TaxID=203523 RepID=UPI0003A665BC|nr:hypothetical protein [Longispora albida]
MTIYRLRGGWPAARRGARLVTEAGHERSGWTDEGAFGYPALVPGGTLAVPCHRYTMKVLKP